MPPFSIPSSAGLTITNPLVLYRALLATRQIDPDPAQHRLAIHLQKLYHRLKDYSPKAEYGSRLKEISQVVEANSLREDDVSTLAVPGHPLRQNPLFARLFAQKERRDILSLTKVFTNDEAAINLDSPQGLLLHGEVGTGKSMLLDLLADCLPNRKKKRWHFNTFMLETLSRLETLRQSRLSSGNLDAEYSLLWVAKHMIENSPILFLDEFQLPDRAASKILSNLLTTFFQLGGVLIASLNRMPDELAKASGVEFAPPPRGSLVRNWLSLGPSNRGRGDIFAGNGEFAGFLEVLKARCEVWDIEGGRDWRRREAEEVETDESVETMREEMVEGFVGLAKMAAGLGYEQSVSEARNTASEDEEVQNVEERTDRKNAIAPKRYLLSSIDTEDTWAAVVQGALPANTPSPIPWEPTTLLVYGRQVPVPRGNAGVAMWSFEELCGGYFGPADYITMASTFHTLILDKVPVLTLLQKNEARRLITLLDALYEARCKLIIRAEAGPDDLFFPETLKPASVKGPGDNTQNDTHGDATYPETFSEIYQDQTSPFRPNVSSYKDVPKTGYDPGEDSEFGPIPGQGNEIGRQVDFGMIGSLIGEDERFAYKRARSRLWEMCGSRWHARSEPGWWRPLPLEIRRWEQSSASETGRRVSNGIPLGASVSGDVKMGSSIELDKPAGLQGKELEMKEPNFLRGN
jgi:peroxisome-assembly ATPase